MKDKLRELAERWIADADIAAGEGNMFNGGLIMTKQQCADELLAILDAEGDAIAALKVLHHAGSLINAQLPGTAQLCAKWPSLISTIKAALAAQGQGEAVAWQIKRRPEDYVDEWKECDKETFDTIRRTEDSPWVVRELFNHPPASPAGVPDGCIPIHRTLLNKLATDMDSIDMPKIGAAIRRWVANYDARQSAAPSAPEGDGGGE